MEELTNIKLKKATLFDSLSLFLIKRTAFKPLYFLYKDKETNPYNESFFKEVKRILNKNNIYFKIIINNKTVGGIRLKFNDISCTGRLSTIFILPKYQAKKIGKKAILLAEEKMSFIKNWELECPVDQPKNIACYTACGFKDTGKRKMINSNLVLAVYKK